MAWSCNVSIRVRWVFFLVGLSAQDVSFRATVPLVLVPATVTDAKGQLRNGLEREAFTVTDNGRVVQAGVEPVEWTNSPVAIAILVQANATAGPALLKAGKAGAMIQPLLIGERGAAAVLTYANSVITSQEFTNDAVLVTRAFRALKPRNEGAGRMLDAISAAISMFQRRPAGERRVILVVGESRDRGSETALEAVHEALQRENIQLYAATYSNFKTQWTTRGTELKQAGAPMDLTAGIDALIRLGQTNTAEALAAASGGRKIGFSTLKGLERLLTRLGDELHGQYFVTFPASAPEGFHSISITVPGSAVQARKGYWATSAANDSRNEGGRF